MADDAHPMNESNWMIHLLGGLRIKCNGVFISLPPFRSQLLLAALLLKPTFRKREQLAGLLFPELPENIARAHLSDRLWLLEHYLPGIPLITSRTEVELSSTPVWVDVDEFRLLVRKGDQASLAQAVELYAGNLLPEQDTDWLLLERENLHVTYTRALQTLAVRTLKSGNHAESVPILEKLHNAEPFDEINLRNLLRAYQAVGQRGAALATFDRFLIMFKTEMDLEPEPATLETVQAIRTQTTLKLHTTQEITLPDTPNRLFRYGQQALWKGDFSALQACIQSLRKKAAESESGEADSLEAAWAILRGDYDSARRLLSEGKKTSLHVLVQKIHLLVELKDFGDIIEQCETAILEAHRCRDRISEMLLLADQGSAYQHTGHMQEAMRCANQVITQAEKDNIPFLIALGLLLKGILQISQGFERDALETFHHAAAYASEHGFLPILSRVEVKLGIAYQNSGKYRLSLQHYEKALQIARDLGMKREEAEVLQDLAITLSCLGRNDESILTIRQSRELFASLNDEQGLARNTYHLAFGLAYNENSNLDESLELGRQALAIFKKHQSLGWVASVYGMLGYIHWLRNEPEAAIQACEQAIPIYQKLGEADFIPELYGYIGLAILQKGDPHKALEYTTMAMNEMMRSELYDIASEIYFAHASSLDAVGRSNEANDLFQRGYENLLTYAAEIEDSEAIQTFFQRDPTVRRLMEQVYARGLAPKPRVVTQLVPTHGRTSLPVALTLDAGAPDVALKNSSGAAALRRARLLRILHEARTQGSILPLEQIAGVMKVNLRTIQRDIRYLKEQGKLS